MEINLWNSVWTPGPTKFVVKANKKDLIFIIIKTEEVVSIHYLISEKQSCRRTRTSVSVPAQPNNVFFFSLTLQGFTSEAEATEQLKHPKSARETGETGIRVSQAE